MSSGVSGQYARWDGTPDHAEILSGWLDGSGKYEDGKFYLNTYHGVKVINPGDYIAKNGHIVKILGD